MGIAWCGDRDEDLFLRRFLRRSVRQHRGRIDDVDISTAASFFSTLVMRLFMMTGCLVIACNML